MWTRDAYQREIRHAALLGQLGPTVEFVDAGAPKEAIPPAASAASIEPSIG